MSKLNSHNIDKLSRLAKFGYISFFIMLILSEIVIIACHLHSHGLTVPKFGSKIGITDFAGLYIAGKMAAFAQRTDLFNIDIFNTYYRNITGCPSDCLDIRIFHLPFLHLFMVPFTYLSIDAAHVVFDLITTSFGLWALCILIKQIGNSPKSSAIVFLLAILASYPAWDNLLQGQIMWLYLGLTSLFLLYFFKKQEFKAGIILSLLSVKPHYAIYLAIPSLVLRRYKLLLFAALGESVLFLICLIAFGPHSLISYVQEFSHHELTSGYTHAELMTCARPFLCLILSPEHAYHASCVIDLFCLLLVTVLSFLVLKKAENKQLISWIFSLIILTALLFSPHGHPHDCLLIAIPAILTLPGLDNSHKLSPSLFIWKWSLYLFPITSWLRSLNFILNCPGNLFFTAIIAVMFLCSLKQVLSAIQLKSSNFNCETNI